MYISYIIYIILHSRCYTGVRAPKLLHRSSYIKEPFGKGLDGLPGGLTGASEGLEGGLRGLRRLQGGLRRASRGLEKGFRGAWRCLAWRGASRGLQGGLRRASRGLQGGLKRASSGGWRRLHLQGGLRRASRGLQGGFKGAWESFKGAWRWRLRRGLEGGLRRASRGFRRASTGFKGLQKRLKGASSPSHLRAPPRGGTLQVCLEGYLRRWWVGFSPRHVDLYLYLKLFALPHPRVRCPSCRTLASLCSWAHCGPSWTLVAHVRKFALLIVWLPASLNGTGCNRRKTHTASNSFFSSSTADHALRLGPYMWRSSLK